MTRKRRLIKTFVVPNTAKKHGYSTTVKVIPVYQGWSIEVNGLFEPYYRKPFKTKKDALKYASKLYTKLKKKYK